MDITLKKLFITEILGCSLKKFIAFMKKDVLVLSASFLTDGSFVKVVQLFKSSTTIYSMIIF